MGLQVAGGKKETHLKVLRYGVVYNQISQRSLAPVWNTNRRQEGRWREQGAVRGCPHESGCGLSQPAVKDRQKGGGSEKCSEACERRGDKAGLGCTSPDSLR